MGFSKIWRKFSLKIYFQEKKKNFEKNYFQEFHLQILENPKNFMISFFHSLNLSGVVLGENFQDRFSPFQRVCREKKSFFKSHLPSKTFPSIHFQTSPNPIPDQSQSHQSLPLKTKISSIKISSPQSKAQITQCFFVGCKGKFRHFNFAFQILHFTRGFDDKPTPEITPRTMGSLLRLQQLPRLQPNRKRSNS